MESGVGTTASTLSSVAFEAGVAMPSSVARVAGVPMSLLCVAIIAVSGVANIDSSSLTESEPSLDTRLGGDLLSSSAE